MNTGFIIEHWNDILTVLTFASTVAIAFYQIRYYKNQQPSFELGSVTNAEYHDFDDSSEYESTIAVKNDGRDPVFIPNAELSVQGEEIQLNNVGNTERFFTGSLGSVCFHARIQNGGARVESV